MPAFARDDLRLDIAGAGLLASVASDEAIERRASAAGDALVRGGAGAAGGGGDCVS